MQFAADNESVSGAQITDFSTMIIFAFLIFIVYAIVIYVSLYL